MDAEAFVRWALDDARTIEERYTTELFVERGVSWWRSRHKQYVRQPIDEIVERKRQRALNPAYEPTYSEESVRRTAEIIPELKSWDCYCSYDERPIRDLKVVQFFTALEGFSLTHAQLADFSPLLSLPHLRKLTFASSGCDDLGSLGRLTQLRELTLHLLTHWPDLDGLENLSQLEFLSLTGNLLAFRRGVTWPNVRRGVLKCEPLAARNMRELPQLPACEFLTLTGVERLDGIEDFPRLRNLTLECGVRDFAPLTRLADLTAFLCKADEPLDVTPLTRVPKLAFLTLGLRFSARMVPLPPRDLAPLTESMTLREFQQEGCKPLEAEAEAINAALPSWDDLLLGAEARPVSPLRFIVAPGEKHPRRPGFVPEPGEPELPDEAICMCHSAWIGRFLTRYVTEKLGDPDWGSASGDAKNHTYHATIESYGVVERFAEILQFLREGAARLRHPFTGEVWVFLKVPPPKPTQAQIEMEEKFREEQDKAEWERRKQERKEYLDRLHRYQLKKQDGTPIKPEEFAPGAQVPLPDPPWERDEDDDDDDPSEGGVAVKEKPDPPPSYDDYQHPLAEEYRLCCHICMTEVWFLPHHRDIAIYLMRRPPDLEIPEEKKEE